MSLQDAKNLETRLLAQAPPTDENLVEPIMQPTNNSSNYIYITAIVLPLLLVIIAIIGIPTAKEGRTGTILKIFAIILILWSLGWMYAYHQKIDVIGAFTKNKKQA